MEEWRDIEGYEGLYQVSNEGRVKSLDRYVDNFWGTKQFVRERILKRTTDKDGYLMVYLCKDGKAKTYKVHRLVWEAFNGEIPEGMEIDHINAVKTDNRFENLRIATHQENLNNPLTRKRMSESHKKHNYEVL